MKNNNMRGDFKQNILQSILSKISVEALARSIGLQVDLARISFVLDSVVVLDFEEFKHLLLAYYIHVLNHLNRVKVPMDFEISSAEVFALLDRAFSNRGGTKAAFTESMNGFHGGMRLILDQLTDQFKKEEMEKRINQVLRYSFDPIEWGIKVSLIKDLLEKLKPNLPPEIYNQPPERYGNHYEILVKNYVNSVDQLQYIFQAI